MTTTMNVQRFQRLSMNGTVLATVRIYREQFLWSQKMARRIDGKLQWVVEPEERLVYTGCPSGEHSIDLGVSSEARAQAHWEGYLEANKIRTAPAVGERINFPSGSATGGIRSGRVVKVGPKRVTVKYRFENGRVTTKSIPLHLCRFHP
jgi:hypothetical protein